MSSAALDDWTGEDVSLDEVERALNRLRADDDRGVEQRTSVMTHIAWIPPKWVKKARAAFAGIDENYPSRTILLLPAPDKPDGLDAQVSLQCFPLGGGGSHVCTEVVELSLRGARAEAPASMVMPLLLPDLPVFLRWRGEPPFGDPTFERLAGLVDRLVVDSREWEHLRAGYGNLTRYFSDQLAVSDIAWARTFEWRRTIAGSWPAVADAHELRVAGPTADAMLLAGWLRSRLERPIELHEQVEDELQAVSVNGEEIAAPTEPTPDPGRLLSAELDRFGRDRIYEDAVAAAALEHVARA